MQTLANPVKYQFLISDPDEFKSVASLYENRFDQMLNYKSCNLDMDISGKSDRIEWGHLRYQSVFYPDASLEFIFQWVVCTGPLVAELLQNWLRKAQNCGVNLVPIPCDPFALPMSHKADPLRAPIFVPLNISALNMNGKTFLEEYPPDSWPQRLLLFQVSIKCWFFPHLEECQALVYKKIFKILEKIIIIRNHRRRNSCANCAFPLHIRTSNYLNTKCLSS